MTRREEHEAAREFRRATVMGAVEKRTIIIELGQEMRRAEHRAPSEAAAMLPRIWELRRALAFGCTPMVCR